MSETFTMIALDTEAVEGEIEEKSALDADFKADVQGITREHINEALRLVSPSDGFYEMFDDLRNRVIDLARELAIAEGTPESVLRAMEDDPELPDAVAAAWNS